MKIIDLLNKIANGEEVPKKIKYDTMNYIFRNYDYKEIHGELIDEQSSWLEKIDFYKLNDEVEIVDSEENNKIEYVGKEYDLTKFYNDYKEPAILLRDMGDKIKELIDRYNKIKEIIDELKGVVEK